jgi:hypothetical protein
VFEKVLLQAGSWEQSSPREKESELYAASFLG